jgi:hypothetical protein
MGIAAINGNVFVFGGLDATGEGLLEGIVAFCRMS